MTGRFFMKKTITYMICILGVLTTVSCGTIDEKSSDQNAETNPIITTDSNTTLDEDTTSGHDKDSSYSLEEALSYVNTVLQQYDENADFKKMDIYEKKDILTPVMDELIKEGYIKKYSFLMDSHPASLSYFFPSGTHGLYFLEDFAPGVN